MASVQIQRKNSLKYNCTILSVNIFIQFSVDSISFGLQHYKNDEDNQLFISEILVSECSLGTKVCSDIRGQVVSRPDGHQCQSVEAVVVARQ